MPATTTPSENKRRRRKIPVLIESGIPIRIIDRTKKPYMVDVARGYTRTRTCFATEAEARAEAIRVAGNLVEEGLQAVALSKDQRLDASRALAALKGTINLEGAAKFYLRHTVAGEFAKPSRDVVAELMATKRGANRRPATLIDAQHRLDRFVATFGDRPLGTITLHDLETWLAALKVGHVTRDNFRRAVVGLFNYGQRRGLCEGNPAAGLARSGRDQTLPSILTPAQAKALMLAAVAVEAGALVPYFAIGLFAGLRPANELAGLEWTNIDFKAKTIRVDPATAKRRRTRFVEIPANLAIWLATYRKDSGRIYYSRRFFRAVVTKAKLGKWQADVMRHTFATYHLSAHGDANATALQLGHAGAPGILFDHYRALAKPKDANAYWKISPKREKVIQFPKAASA